MNIRARMAEKTGNLRSTSDIQAEEVQRPAQTPKTGPGMAGALAAANMRIQELEAAGAQSELPLHEIVPNPWQPRRVFDPAKLSELAESIREVGLVEPIIVRRVQAAYQLVAGERRLRAHQMLEKPTIRALVVECSDQDMAVLALVENVNREDLADYEIGQSLRRSEAEFPNRKRMAEALGMSRAGLYRFLSFDALPDFVRNDLNLNPRLLGGNAAQDLVATLKKHGDAGISATKELWPFVVAGKMDQGKIAAAVSTMVSTQRSTNATSTERRIEKLFSGRQHAGSITKDSHSFTVKIKSGVLSDAQEAQIRELMNQLFNDEVG
ncbi:ParB/RepB/Spo0J family partition protein [Paraburkholderia humisilvae]|uniref:Nucleoid occlusion protein n=1 Tax=Paraburkholderia humisilvae TaxID=627669 RepID=A0A6J5F4V8_9BURK|nr:ParB/RepB/Spo0J family partition protein [Paraburkholderia humisilvae]CAB3773829.1 Nucleoid occlusion protein [Paraburkholderia humisilvae]